MYGRCPTAYRLSHIVRAAPGEADSYDFARQLTKMGYMDVKVLAHPAIQGVDRSRIPYRKKGKKKP